MTKYASHSVAGFFFILRDRSTLSVSGFQVYNMVEELGKVHGFHWSGYFQSPNSSIFLYFIFLKFGRLDNSFFDYGHHFCPNGHCILLTISIVIYK